MEGLKKTLEKPLMQFICIAREYSGILFAVGIVAIYIVARFLSSPDSHAQLKFIDAPDRQTITERSQLDGTITDIFSGTKYETAKRLRESAALGIAASIAIFFQYYESKTFPQTGREVISDIVSRKLLPPEISVENEGFRSPTSIIRFSFRPSPFSFEILSVPIEDKYGPTMLFRFPLPPGGQNSFTYFRSTGTTDQAPFSTTEQLAAQGWEIAQWNIDELKLDGSSTNELKEQREWLKSIKPETK
ncbi:MAG: hypothetical protein KF756_05935 [Acidobacteria bacterium]|nr:hypothetical protein [Acidobacteriota bacterium]